MDIMQASRAIRRECMAAGVDLESIGRRGNNLCMQYAEKLSSRRGRDNYLKFLVIKNRHLPTDDSREAQAYLERRRR